MSYPGVTVIGITGLTASGKSTLATKVAETFHSPLVPIQQDWFYKEPSKLPDGGSRSQPASVDWVKLGKEIVKVAAAFGPNKTIVPSTQVEGTEGKIRNLSRPKAVGTPIRARPIVVVVEGHLLFSDPSIVKLLSHFIWLDTSLDVGCARRFLRDVPKWGTGPAKDSNPAYEAFKQLYTSHMYHHFTMYKNLQLNNVKNIAMSWAKRIDADLPKEAVALAAMQYLNTRVKGKGNKGIVKGKVKGKGKVKRI
jgi:uridine kinase